MNKVSCVDMILLCEKVEISWNLEILNHDECWYYHDALLPVVWDGIFKKIYLDIKNITI